MIDWLAGLPWWVGVVAGLVGGVSTALHRQQLLNARRVLIHAHLVCAHCGWRSAEYTYVTDRKTPLPPQWTRDRMAAEADHRPGCPHREERADA